MKVLFAWNSWVEPENHRLLDHLRAMGADVHALSPESWTEGGRLQHATTVPGMTVLPVWRRDHIRSFFYPAGAVDRVVAETRPDLVHIFQEPYACAAFQLVRATLSRAPAARIVLHSFDNLEMRQPFPFSMFERKTLAAAHGLIVVPEEGESLWRKRGYGGPILRLGHGFDDAAYHPAARRSTRPVIGYVGRLVPEKGVETLVEACAALERGFELWLVGAGSQEMGLRDLADARGITDRVRFLGAKDKAELAALYPKMDILVLPSRTTPRWKEQFGRVLVEAMACEVAVVGSDSGEIPNVIGDAGTIVPEGNAEALAAALRKLFDDSDLRRSLGQAGRRRVLERYTWKAIAERLHAFYTSLLR